MSAVVVGGGVDGLVAALRLARGGHRVTVIERDTVVGGRFAGRSFGDGFRTPGLLHDTSGVPSAVIGGLGLDAHGVRRTPRCQVWSVAAGQPAVAIPFDLQPSDSLVDHDANDAAGLAAFARRLGTWAPALRGALLDPVPGVLGDDLELVALGRKALAVRRMGVSEMFELLRVAPGSVDDLLSEWVSSPRLRATLAWPALLGAWMGPLSPQSATNLLLHEVSRGDDVEGLGPALVEALERACRAASVTVLTGRAVARMVVEKGRVRAVGLDDGEEVGANIVIAAVPATTALLDLVEPLVLPEAVEDEARTFRVRGITAKVHIAIEGAPRWHGTGGARPRHVRTAVHPLDLERAFDAVKYGRMAERPCLDVRMLEEGFASDGHSVLSVLAHGVPHDLRGGWTDDARVELGRRVRAVLEDAAPGIGGKVVAEEVLSPADLEAHHALPGGHLFHGEHALDQLWINRPCVALSRHATPIRGLFLGSASIHPGGFAPGASGLLAAEAALRAS